MSLMTFKLSVLLICCSLINQSLAAQNETPLMKNRHSVPFEQKPLQNFVLYRSFNSTKKEAVNVQTENLLRLSTIGNQEKSAPVFQPAHIIQKNVKDTKKYSARKETNKQNSHLKKGQRSHHGISQIKSIYQTLRDGDSINNDRGINTIRYIPASKFETNEKLYFLFNLSLLTSTEKVFKSELFINKRYIRQRLTFDLHYFFYTTKLNSGGIKSKKKSGGPSMTLDLSNYIGSDFGRQNQWESFNILNSIRSYLTMRASIPVVNQTNLYYTFNNNEKPTVNEDNELVLIMEATSFGRQRRRRNLVENLNPYLMIYSNEDDKQMMEFFESRITDKLEARIIDKPSVVEDKVIVSNKDMEELKKFEDQVDKLNIEDQSIDKVENNSGENSILLADYLIKKSDQHQAVANHYDDFLANTDRLLYGSDINNRLQKRDLNDEIVFDESKWKFDHVGEGDLKSNQLEKCEKKPILIDFIDMSFNQWIIEPKRFQSSYCTGSCKFPSNKKVTFSNYATLQSILNSLRFVNSPPPELCCTPTSTSPLPVLYTDLNGRDTVVKLLPDMIVDDCSCH